MDHAVAVGMRPDNAAHGIKRLRHKSEGLATWSEYDIEAYRAYWPLGSRERLALELALNTGQRRGDLARMGWQHVQGGAIHVRQSKTGATVAVPLSWDGLAKVKSAAAFDIRSAAKQRDPWRDFFKTKQALPRGVSKL